jgi:phytoene dehydrogenase-like protein
LIKEYGPVTVPEFADRFFNKGTGIYNFISTIGYPNMSSVGLAGMMEMFRDYWTVKDGMQSWADALADNFKSLGGDLKLSTYVDTIITKDGAAVGAKVGDQVYEADFVLSAGDYKKTFHKLLDDTSPVPNDILKKIKEAPVSESFFTVYAGINMPNDKLRQCMKVAAVMLCNTAERGYADNPAAEDFFSKGPLFVYSPSMINEQLAPEGKSSLMLQTVSPHGWMDNWGGGNKEKYKALKKSATETFIKRAEKIIPDLSKLIEYSDAATPLTYERYTHNTDGASSSWSWHARKGFYPPGTMMKIDTPVKNLYISSCWAAPNGGVPGALEAGYRCAQTIK